MEAVGTADIYRRARKPILTQDQQNSPPKKATATARAKGGAVHVSLASNHLKLWLLPTVVSITPDDAMALSIELQKAAIDARVSEAPPPITVEGWTSAGRPSDADHRGGRCFNRVRTDQGADKEWAAAIDPGARAASEIASMLGVERNAVLGRAWRKCRPRKGPITATMATRKKSDTQKRLVAQKKPKQNQRRAYVNWKQVLWIGLRTAAN
jgi:hypothetical protein